MISAGTVLLLITIIGHWAGRSSPLFQEKLDSNLNDQEITQILFDTVTKRFNHGIARHTFSSNWLLCLAGKINPAFSAIRIPSVMVARGKTLICSQSSYLLLDIAIKNGIIVRHVGLYGHVVMEAWYEKDWHYMILIVE